MRRVNYSLNCDFYKPQTGEHAMSTLNYKTTSKRILIIGLALLPMTLACIPNTSKAEDYYHRDSRDRRRSDWNRGFSDGKDCRRLLQKVRVSLCQDYRNNYKCGQSSTAEYYQLVMDINRFGSRGTKYIFNDYLHCKGQRRTAFDRDIERESADWHSRNPNR
jgi:hypothetical protein